MTRQILQRPEKSDLTTLGSTLHTRPLFGLGVSGVVALFCFVSLAALPWVIYARGEWILMDLGAAVFWLLIGSFSAAVHGGHTGSKRDQQSEKRP